MFLNYVINNRMKPNQDFIDSVIESLRIKGEKPPRPNSMLAEEYETEITSRNRVSTSSDLHTERRQNIKEENAESRRNQFLRQRSHSYVTGRKLGLID